MSHLLPCAYGGTGSDGPARPAFGAGGRRIIRICVFRLTMEPLFFEPIYRERVWGGRRLETLLGRALPGGIPIGESWELVDREEAQSIVRDGPLAGRTLHDLWQNDRKNMFGALAPAGRRFPILVKLLDAADRLSLQVHPPASLAARFHGEPKSEMWYVIDTAPGSELYVGLRRGVTRESFAKAAAAGTVADCFHRIPTRAGDCMFLPSGRVHAIGAGHLIAEIQQNSDTTFRVYDWGRKGLDGKPRRLHVAESLECIDFSDYEPGLQRAKGEVLVSCPLFNVSLAELGSARTWDGGAERFYLFMPLHGPVVAGGREVAPGEFFLLPANAGPLRIQALRPEARILVVTW